MQLSNLMFFEVHVVMHKVLCGVTSAPGALARRRRGAARGVRGHVPLGVRGGQVPGAAVGAAVRRGRRAQLATGLGQGAGQRRRHAPIRKCPVLRAARSSRLGAFATAVVSALRNESGLLPFGKYIKNYCQNYNNKFKISPLYYELLRLMYIFFPVEKIIIILNRTNRNFFSRP